MASFWGPIYTPLLVIQVLSPLHWRVQSLILRVGTTESEGFHLCAATNPRNDGMFCEHGKTHCWWQVHQTMLIYIYILTKSILYKPKWTLFNPPFCHKPSAKNIKNHASISLILSGLTIISPASLSSPPTVDQEMTPTIEPCLWCNTPSVFRHRNRENQLLRIGK